MPDDEVVAVLCAVRKDGTYYLDPFDSSVHGPFLGPNNTRQSLHQRHGKNHNFKLVHNMTGKLAWPPEYKP